MPEEKIILKILMKKSVFDELVKETIEQREKEIIEIIDEEIEWLRRLRNYDGVTRLINLKKRIKELK